MRIECPHCGAAGEIDETKRPPGAVSIRCPRCRGTIPFEAEVTGRQHPEASEDMPDDAPRLPPAGTPPRPDMAGGLMEDAARPVTDGSVVSPGEDAPVKGVCSLCYETFPRDDMLRIGSHLICASCKPIYEQMLQEGVPLPGDSRYAGFWQRFAAKLIDYAIVWGVNFALGMAVLVPMGLGAGALSLGTKSEAAGTIFGSAYLAVILAVNLLKLCIPVALNTVFIGKYAATPGKMALGLKVVRPGGDRISYKRALGRACAELISFITLVFCVPFFAIGYLLMLFDKQRRTLHDMICDTRVIIK